MSENAPESAGNIVKFQISSNFTEYAVELSAGVVDFRYYENVLANNVTATATIVETGYQADSSGDAGGKQSTVDGLPIRGGERTDITIEDAYGNEIDALSEEGENLKKDAINMLKGEEISSNESASSNVSAVSTHASYEGTEAGTVILTKPDKKNYTGRSGQKRYEQAMIMYNNQKEMLNSYQKTQVKASLAKI